MPKGEAFQNLGGGTGYRRFKPTSGVALGTPTRVSAATISGESASISWSPPTQTSPVVTGYRVTRDGVDSGGFGVYTTVVAASARSFTFSSLVTMTYNFSVSAIYGASGESGSVVKSITPTPSVLAVTVVGYGTAAVGTAWDSTFWNAGQANGASFTQQASGVGRITTGVTANSNTQVKARRFLEGGEVSGSIKIPDTSASACSIHLYATRTMGRNYMSTPFDGWFIEILQATGVARFRYAYREISAQYGQTVLTLAPGSVINYAVRPGVGVWLWLSGQSRPVAPTIPTTEAQFPKRAFGWMGYGVNNGTAASRSYDFSPMTFDPLTGKPPRLAMPNASMSPNLALPYVPTADLPTGAVSITFDDQCNGSGLDTTKWVSDLPEDGWGGIREGTWGRGVVKGSTLFESPPSSKSLEVANGRMLMKATLDPTIPSFDGAGTGRRYRTVELMNKRVWSSGTSKKYAVEWRFNMSSTRGLWPLLWLMGEGGYGTGDAWPINGEFDVLEGFNNLGLFCRPTTNAHYPRDWQTNPPGTAGNNTHLTASPNSDPAWAGGNTGMYDSWHTLTAVVTPTYAKTYWDGVLKNTYVPNVVVPPSSTIIYSESIPIPPRFFTAPKFIFTSLAAGGQAAEGFDDEQLEDGTMEIDYVRCWEFA